MIYYFTGTGNSLWAANELAQKLNDKIKNVTEIKENETVNDNFAGIVCPIYMGDMPWIVKQQLLNLKISSNTYCFALFTSNLGKCGKAAFTNADKLFCRAGNRLSAFYNISMPGNCLISSQKQNAERLSAAPSKIEKIFENIQNKAQNYKSKGIKADAEIAEKSFFYKNKSLRQLTPIKNFEITESCNGCGVCKNICPLNNISIEKNKAVHKQVCAACYACVHWCPKNATKVKLPILHNRFQYSHPLAKADKNGISLKK